MASVSGILNIQSLNELTSENTTLGGTVGSHLAGHSVTALQQRLTRLVFGSPLRRARLRAAAVSNVRSGPYEFEIRGRSAAVACTGYSDTPS